MIKAFIFDMDGVIINTEFFLDKDEFLFLRNLTNNKWTVKNQKSIKGISIDDLYFVLINEFCLKLPKDIFLKNYNTFLEKIYREKVQLNPGIIDLLNELRVKKYKIALASSTSHRFIRLVLKKFLLADYFNVVVSADDINGKSKPNPEIFLLTSRKLGISPKNCTVIEDSLNGIRAAKRAGMFCIAYQAENVNKLQREQLSDYKINDFQELLNVNLSKILSPKYFKQVEKTKLKKETIYLILSDHVNKSDYYSNFLLLQLVKLISDFKNRPLKILEIGTGRGYIAISLAKLFNNITNIIATDIEHNAINLALQNVLLNSLENKIEIRTQGDLFVPIKNYEKFDIIFSAPPQMPFTKDELSRLKSDIPSYHLTTSAGGKDGQKIIRQLITQAQPFLKKGGVLAFVQADFSCPNKALQLIQKIGPKKYSIKTKKKLLGETTLTKMLKLDIEKKGYVFNKNAKGEEYFSLITIIAQKK